MKLFIWDFHGVLEKGNENAVIHISNKALEKNGYEKRFLESDIDRLYGLKWYQYFSYLMPELSLDDCHKLQLDCFENQFDNWLIIDSIIKPSDNSLDVLKKIKKSGNHQILISNTRPNDIIRFLESVHIRKLFDDDKTFGVNSHQTNNSKIDILDQYLTDKKYDKIICIGDSEGDLELGRSVGAINYYYKHPYRQHEATDKADFIINDLREVLKEL